MFDGMVQQPIFLINLAVTLYVAEGESAQKAMGRLLREYADALDRVQYGTSGTFETSSGRISSRALGEAEVGMVDRTHISAGGWG